MLQPGATVDRFIVEAVIGEGGMAVVYQVRHKTLGTTHALKLLTIQSTDVKERMIQEGRLQASLRHDNIVGVTDVIEVDGSPGLLMEYIEGPTLDWWLVAHPASPAELLAIFRGICRGVGFAHERGLIHRDLKPGNILLAVNDNHVVPKVLDFGLAKARGNTSMSATRTGTTMGTPTFMGPEQIRDASKVDRRADLYSVGCILYQMFGGRPPHQSEDLLELFQLIGAGTYTPLRALNPDVPEAVEQVIDGLLKPNPADRWDDIASVLAVLDGEAELRRTGVPAGADLPPPRPIGPPNKPCSLGPADPGTQMALRLRAAIREKNDAQRASAPSIAPSEPARPAIPAAPVTTESPRLAKLGIAAILALIAGGLVLVGGLGLLIGVLVARLTSPPVDAPDSPVASDVDLAPTDAPTDAPVPIDPAPIDPAPIAPPPITPAPTTPAPSGPGPIAAAPAKPAPSARPNPTAAPVPTPRVSPYQGTFRFSGARQVYLEDDDGRSYRAGEPVPAGPYKVKASFDGGAAVVGAGRTTIAAGAERHVQCSADFQQCK